MPLFVQLLELRLELEFVVLIIKNVCCTSVIFFLCLHIISSEDVAQEGGDAEVIISSATAETYSSIRWQIFNLRMV